MDDNNEEIRRLDNQLDHLNEYMAKVEKRLTAHNEKLKETLKQQREDREKRRRSDISQSFNRFSTATLTTIWFVIQKLDNVEVMLRLRHGKSIWTCEEERTPSFDAPNYFYPSPQQADLDRHWN